MEINYLADAVVHDDWLKAFEFYRQAAEQGNIIAQRRLGCCGGLGSALYLVFNY